MIRLRLEFLGLYVGLPVLLLGLRLGLGSFPVLPVLWLAAYPAVRYLVSQKGWGKAELSGFSMSRRQGAHLALRVLIAAAALSAGMLLLAPGHFLELPRRQPGLWALVMVFYPLVSVYPQSVLYRGLYYARYACLFPTERARWLAGALAFSLAHLVFANGWAVALTLVGGLLINRTYRKTGSLMAANLEHALYGQLVFTCGWGHYLYHGTLRLMEGVSG